MPTLEAAAAAPPSTDSGAPAATLPAPPPAAPGTTPVPLAPKGDAKPAGRYAVEQRVVSEEMKERRYEEPSEEDLRKTLLEVLPPEMVEGVPLPLTYRLASQAGYNGLTMRIATSGPARSKQYTCLPFYKPISRCVGGRE